MEQAEVSAVPERAKQGTEATGGERRKLWWAEASIWTDRMVSALESGVRGGKWFSLVDKIIRPATLEAAWQRVARNKGAAGVDGQDTERFALQAERYLRELQASLEDGSYRPHPVKRVEIPKGDGKTRPLGIPVVKACPRAGEAGPEGPYRAGGSEDGHRANPPGPPAGRPEDML
jgi:RNA-directed DNA polymerase